MTAQHLLPTTVTTGQNWKFLSVQRSHIFEMSLLQSPYHRSRSLKARDSLNHFSIIKKKAFTVGLPQKLTLRERFEFKQCIWKRIPRKRGWGGKKTVRERTEFSTGCINAGDFTGHLKYLLIVDPFEILWNTKSQSYCFELHGNCNIYINS